LEDDRFKTQTARVDNRRLGEAIGGSVLPVAFPGLKNAQQKGGEQHGRIRGAFLFEFINMIVLQCFARLEVLDQ
jgi:hypothetical protein